MVSTQTLLLYAFLLVDVFPTTRRSVVVTSGEVAAGQQETTSMSRGYGDVDIKCFKSTSELSANH